MSRRALGSAIVALVLTFGTASAEAVWIPFDSASPTPPTVNVISGTSGYVQFQIMVHGMFVDDTVVGGTTFQILSLPGEGTMSELGWPQLPQVTRLIGFAPGAEPTSQYEFGDSLSLEGYYVFPAQIPQTDSYPAQAGPFVLDSGAYRANEYYPALDDVAATHELGIWRDLGAAVAVVRPFHFNPAQRKLVVYRTLTVTYTFEGGSALPAAVALPCYQAYAGSLLNFSYLGISPGGEPPLRFMIVLGEDTPALRQAVEPLRVWKCMQGYEAQVHCVGSEIPRDANAIKAWIASRYNPGSYQLFILFVGDHDLIPSPGGWLIPPPRTDSIYSDHWYACVAGDDDIADVDLGRISSSDPEVVSVVIQKEMRYERSTGPNWKNTRVLVVSNYLNSEYEACKERIAVRLEDMGISCHRQHGSDPGVTNATLMDKINSGGCYGTLNYRGHGLQQSWELWNTYNEYFQNGDILQLTNSDWLPLVYEICCCCGNIHPAQGGDEGHSETWVEHAGGGGVAAWGATRPSATSPNHVLDESLCTIPFTRQTTYTNVVMNAAKLEMLREFPNAWGHANNQMYHLNGDPSLHVWMADSGGLDLTFSPQEIYPWRPYYIDAHVARRSGGQPVRSAAVGVYKQDDILGSARTNANGDAQIYVYAHSGGTIQIEASKPLFHGDEGIIIVNSEGPQGSEANVPREFSLWVPPVAKGELRIRAEIPRPAGLRLTVCDATGRVVASVSTPELSTGSHWIGLVQPVAGRELVPGSYFVRYESDLGSGLLKTLVVR
jgi:hypothetical protein